jgi:hypothetical protein
MHKWLFAANGSVNWIRSAAFTANSDEAPKTNIEQNAHVTWGE